jgi:hypothetical protein
MQQQHGQRQHAARSSAIDAAACRLRAGALAWSRSIDLRPLSVRLHQPKSRLYAAKALSAESPQQSAVVYSCCSVRLYSRPGAITVQRIKVVPQLSVTLARLLPPRERTARRRVPQRRGGRAVGGPPPGSDRPSGGADPGPGRQAVVRYQGGAARGCHIPSSRLWVRPLRRSAAAAV